MRFKNLGLLQLKKKLKSSHPYVKKLKLVSSLHVSLIKPSQLAKETLAKSKALKKVVGQGHDGANFKGLPYKAYT